MLDVILDTLIDAVKILPFLFVAYLIMEYLEHKTGDKTKNLIKKSGKLGPLFGGMLGVFPQCGFSAAASNLYAGRIITTGTLIAVYLSTSDEMLPVLISEKAPIGLIFKIIGIKLLIGIIAGFFIDIIRNLLNKKDDSSENAQEEIGHMCEHEHCHCNKDGILKSAIKHTFSILLFIVLITLVVNVLIYFVGEDNISNLVLNTPIVGPLISGIVGLIPNCAGSVILTQLYLNNVISVGSMIGGLLVGSGIGILVLFRVNKNMKENFKILTVLYLIGALSGIVLDIIMH